MENRHPSSCMASARHLNLFTPFSSQLTKDSAGPQQLRIASAFPVAVPSQHENSFNCNCNVIRNNCKLTAAMKSSESRLSVPGSFLKATEWLSGHIWGSLNRIEGSGHELGGKKPSLSKCSWRGSDVVAFASRRSEGIEVDADAEEQQILNLDDKDDSEEWTHGVTSLDYPRIFSNVNEASLKHQPGSLISSILLVAGTTVGAGILALPAVTEKAGFLASAPTCVVCWLYMATTGLLMAEVNVNTMCELGSGGVSLVSMAERTLGKLGVMVACSTYIFIHYALLVAYVAKSSEIISSAVGLPPEMSAVIFSGALGGLCYFGSQAVIGAVNGGLVAAIIASFFLLLGLGGQNVDPANLLRADFAAVPQTVPIIALSFVYHNVVPVVATNLEGNLPRIRSAIVFGTAIPLLMFLAWDAVILGSSATVAVGQSSSDVAATAASVDPLVNLRGLSSLVAPAVDAFSLLAVATSYIGFVLGLSDFLGDLLKLPSGRGQQQLPFVLTLLPPMFFALVYPDVFFKALDFAGTYGVLVLFGILPAAMAWSERYSLNSVETPFKPLVPGGKLSLGFVLGGASLIIANEVFLDITGAM